MLVIAPVGWTLRAEAKAAVPMMSAPGRSVSRHLSMIAVAAVLTVVAVGCAGARGPAITTSSTAAAGGGRAPTSSAAVGKVRAAGDATGGHATRSGTAPAGGVAAPGTTIPGVTIRLVPPRATSPTIGRPWAPDVVAVAPHIRPNGLLFVFLPGTAAAPRNYRLVVAQAALLGYRAVGLDYPNQRSVGDRCQADPTCYGPVRQNILTGQPSSTRIAIRPADSIEHRLGALLRYLGERYPGEGWQRFVAGGSPVWSQTVVAGHSQGGGEAAYIGKVRQVSGVVMFSAPVDATTGPTPRPATWLSRPGRTPLSRYLGLADPADGYYARIRASWTGLGLDRFGRAVTVAGARTPNAGAAELLIAAAPGQGPLAAHSGTVADLSVTRCPGGAPLLAPVWRYLLRAAGGLSPGAGGAETAGCPT
ncbi:MAG: BPSS1187 family protein [Frankia sp.]